MWSSHNQPGASLAVQSRWCEISSPELPGQWATGEWASANLRCWPAQGRRSVWRWVLPTAWVGVAVDASRIHKQQRGRGPRRGGGACDTGLGRWGERISLQIPLPPWFPDSALHPFLILKWGEVVPWQCNSEQACSGKNFPFHTLRL